MISRCQAYDERSQAPYRVARAAYQALCYEACLTPKPGLVDRANNGAHQDMNLRLFLASARSLRPFLLQCAVAAWETDNAGALFAELKPLGIRAEQAMYAVTNGVNTHKGAIFSLGLLTAAATLAVRLGQGLYAVQHHTRALCGRLLEKELADAPQTDSPTAGERCFQNYRIAGARGQAQAGYPHIFEEALPLLRQTLRTGQSLQSGALRALLHLITRVDDTNIINRTGLDGLQFARNCAITMLERNCVDIAELARMDKLFIRKNISPGGCADLLAATCFLHFLLEQGLLLPVQRIDRTQGLAATDASITQLAV